MLVAKRRIEVEWWREDGEDGRKKREELVDAAILRLSKVRNFVDQARRPAKKSARFQNAFVLFFIWELSIEKFCRSSNMLEFALALENETGSRLLN